MQATLFDEKTENNLRLQIFLKSKLGRYYSSLPLEELSCLLPERKADQKGAKGRFTKKGKIALQFLKPYLKLSDETLLERLNSDWMLQYFCDLRIKLSEPIKDKNIIWRTRKYVATHLEKLGINSFQEVLIEKWKAELETVQIGMSDATCYESYIKYPTDVELLWDCIVWLKEKLSELCQQLRLRQPRNKFRIQEKRHLTYMRKRRKFKKAREKRCKQSLHLCNKLIGQFQETFETGLKMVLTSAI